MGGMVRLDCQVRGLAASSARRGLAHPSWLFGRFLKWTSSELHFLSPICPEAALCEGQTAVLAEVLAAA